MAVWASNGSSVPQTAAWDGASFAAPQGSTNVGEFRIIQGAAAGARDEAVVAGIASSGAVAGELWNGSGWVALPGLGSVSQTYWWGVAVGYESDSGDAVVVYADGANLNYRVWNGSTWTAEASIALPLGGSPRQLRLAAHPFTDEMVLVVSNSSSQDYAVVWDGASWGDTIVLASNGTGNDRTDINVAYEAQTGRALVVFGAGNDDVRYRIWSGSWSGESILPGIGGGYARWTTVAADPTSDRIAMGVLTNDRDVWVAMWDGGGWVDQTTVTTNTTGTTEPAVTVAFEGNSGEALTVYGEVSNTPRYRVWDPSSGWSAEASAPSIGATSNSAVLFKGSGENGLMLVVQDDNSDLHWIHWDGAIWGPEFELETNSGETKNQPFLFL